MTQLNVLIVRAFAVVAFVFLPLSCLPEPVSASETTALGTGRVEHIVILFIDGPRYSETWGDSAARSIPRLRNELAPQGAVLSNMRNEGVTRTVAGHAAVLTGTYENLPNDGSRPPTSLGLLHAVLRQPGARSNDAWLVTSKDKLHVLGHALRNPDAFALPQMSCGTNGPGADVRADTMTMQVAEEVLTSERPKLLVINLGQPDIAGHGGDWNAYLAALSQSDSLAAGLWRFIQGDSHLANRTILFITSDHGRHLDEVHGGFAAHGCGCEGCRRVVLWALGPGIRRGFVSDRPADLIDVTATVARLLHLDGLTLSGHVLADLFDAHVERKLRIKGSGEMIGNSGK